MKKISLSDTPLDIMQTMSEGNPGALRVLMDVLTAGPLGLFDILHLDDMVMRCPQIWVAYKDHCKEDINTFVAAIRARDPQMVQTVNAEITDRKAVVNGASFH